MSRTGLATGTAIDPRPKIDSIGRRYAATLLAQGLQMAASVATAGIVPRWLGPADYGNYSFLLTMAATLRSFTEPSAQQAFFTFSSQEEQSGPLTKLYAGWMLAQLGLLLIIVGLVAAAGFTNWVWPGQRFDQIVLLTIVDWTMFLVLMLKQLGDSKGLTVRPQMFGAGAALATLVGVAVLALVHDLTFYTFAWLNIVTAIAAAAVLSHWLLRKHASLCWEGRLAGRAGVYLSRWWAYARPLIVVEYYTPLIALLSPYLIQRWYGSIEQGQFALASRWSAVVLVFTSSAVMIVWREIASATGRGALSEAGALYERLSKPFLFLSLALCFWVSFSAPSLVRLLAGSQFDRAIPVLMVMAFYPLAQTIGQLSTAALKAAGRTAEYRNWAIVLSVPDALLTYFLLAPRTAFVPGLGLGPLGVALKMTVFALVTVQFYEREVLEYFGVGYRGASLRNLAIALLVGACAVLGLLVGDRVVSAYLSSNLIARIVLTSTAYAAMLAAAASMYPDLAESRRTVVAALQRIVGGTS